MYIWPSKSDASILRQVLAGNHNSFQTIVERYVRVVRGVALAYLANPHDADDVVQDTFLRAFEARERLCTTSNLGAWLITVAKNRCYDLLRKRTRELGTPIEDAETATVRPAPEREELYRTLWDEVHKLEPDMREVLMLYYFSRKNTRAIAVLLGITSDAAQKRLQRARTALGERMVETIGSELPPRSDSGADTKRVMAVLATKLPEFSPAPVPAAAAAITVSTPLLLGVSACVVAAVAIITIAAVYHNTSRGAANKSSGATESRLAAAQPAPSNTVDAEKIAAAIAGADAVTSAPTTQPGKVGGRVRGIVVSADGNPVPNASIEVHERTWNSKDETAHFASSTRADGHGVFSIDALPLRVSTGGYFREFEISATAGDLSGSANLSGMPWLQDRFIEIAVYPCGTITGVVRAADGKPVEGAFVSPSLQDYYVPIGWTGGSGKTAETDEQGRFAITGVLPGTSTLLVYGNGYQRLETAAFPYDAKDIALTLEPIGHGVIRGTVIDATTRAGVSGIPVAATQTDAGDKRPPATGTTQSGADGSFTIANLPAGTFRLRLGNCDYAFVEQPSPFVVAEGRLTEDLTLAIEKGAVVSGRALGAGREVGVAAHSAQAGESVAYGSTREDGTYRITGLPTGSYTLEILNGSAKASQTIDVEAGKSYEGIDIAPQPVWQLKGTVVDAQGNGVAQTTVLALTGKAMESLQFEPWSGGRGARVAVSAADGSFSIDLFEVEPVRVQAVGWRTVSAPTNLIAPNDKSAENLMLTLEPAASIEGQVVLPSGKNAGRTVLIAIPQDAARTPIYADEESPGRLVGFDHLDARMAAGIKTKAGLSGRFLFPTLLPGSYEIHVFTLGMTVERNAKPVTVTVAPGEQIRDLRVVLPLEGGANVQGKLTLGGTPLKGQKVEIERVTDIPTISAWSTWTAEDGSYHFEGIQPGEHVLSVMRHVSDGGGKGLREISHYFTVGEGDTANLDFDLAPGTCSVSGLVTANGAPISDAKLFIKRDDVHSEETRAYTDSNGHFAAAGLEQGVYDVQVLGGSNSDDGRGVFSQFFKFTLAAGEATELHFEITVGGLVGSVSGLRDGELGYVVLVPGVVEGDSFTLDQLKALREKAQYRERVREGESRYVIFAVEPGTYTAIAVAYPANAESDEQAFATLRLKKEIVEIGIGNSVKTDFAL